MQQQDVAAPVLVSYYFACAALFGIGIFELFRRRRKQAVWDFIFVVFALFCLFLLYEFQHTKVK